jgi:uncharacterized membrane protein YdbT with pleckstrin-like domain
MGRRRFAVGFPDDSLTSDEHVVLHLHPHWAAMIAPTFWTVVGIAAVVAGAIFLPSAAWANAALVVIGAVALVLFLWLAFWPFVVWRSTHFVFTNERVLLREGVFNRQQRDIPLTRVNDVSSSQSLLDRLLGCGKLTVESAGERGQSVLTNIPKVVQVQKVVYELVEADHERRTVDDHDLRAALRETLGQNDKTQSA